MKEIKRILEDHYNLREFKLEGLEGFEDQTIKVITRSQTSILKKQHYSLETLAIIEAEHRVLIRLDAVETYAFPRAINTIKGQSYLVEDNYIFRLLTYVEGELLGAAEQTEEVLESFGTMLATMNQQLQSLQEPAVAARENHWDLRNLSLNLPLIEHIEDPGDRSLAAYYFMQFEENVLPIASGFRNSILHNDANDWNVTVDGDRVKGIFDFGDIAYSWLINEVAIGATYIMMNKTLPLESAVQFLRGYHEIIPLEEEELDALYYLVAARLCISLCHSAYGKKLKPDSDYITISEKPAWDLLKKWIKINPLKARNTFRTAFGYTSVYSIKSEDLIFRRNRILSKSLSLSYKTPIAMQGAAFQYMYGSQGETYLDAYNNIMLTGHCHPHVVRSGQQTMARLNTNTRYLYEFLYRYGERLLERFPDPLNKVFFVNSGSEASDLAIRMSRAYTARQGVMVLEHGYHGHTSLGIEISHYKYASSGGHGRRPDIVDTPMPKFFGSGFLDESVCGQHFAKVAADRLSAAGIELAAFIAEPVMGCGGQVPLAKSFLKSVYKLVREHGGLCISDEVQVGFGRLGEVFWGYELHDVVPDILILGKPMGNGHPIGAVITTEKIAESFEKGPEFFSSFGGNPVSCAIGLAVLEVIENERLQQQAKDVGNHLKTLLYGLQERFAEVADIRGYGMFLGVELAKADGTPLTLLAGKIKNELRQNNILVGTDGPYDNVIKIKPPLAFNKDDAKLLTDTLERIMRSIL
ncbi:MAG: aminotransferase class III-fold pyridoxal phosphate-dependent enzyme [Flavobacteriaceae bacterium]